MGSGVGTRSESAGQAVRRAWTQQRGRHEDAVRNPSCKLLMRCWGRGGRPAFRSRGGSHGCPRVPRAGPGALNVACEALALSEVPGPRTRGREPGELTPGGRAPRPHSQQQSRAQTRRTHRPEDTGRRRDPTRPERAAEPAATETQPAPQPRGPPRWGGGRRRATQTTAGGGSWEGSPLGAWKPSPRLAGDSAALTFCGAPRGPGQEPGSQTKQPSGLRRRRESSLRERLTRRPVSEERGSPQNRLPARQETSSVSRSPQSPQHRIAAAGATFRNGQIRLMFDME